MSEPEPIPDERHLNKAQRFVRLVELLQQPGGVTAEHVMARFDLDDRTLRRYLTDLRDLGLPLDDQGRASTRTLRLDPNYSRQAVQLSLLELISLHFGRTLFAFLRGTGFVDDLDDAIERLRALHDAPAFELTHDLDRKFMAVPEHAKDYAADSELIDEVLTTLLRQNPARALYARVSGPVRQYRLQPYTLATYRQGLYLFALDLDAGKVKSFALDRFRFYERLRGETFDYPEEYDPKALVADCFGILGGPIADVELEFNRSAAPYIRERQWHRSQQLGELDGGALRLGMRVGVSMELVRWILGFGPDVKVLAPPELASRVAWMLRDAATNAAVAAVEAGAPEDLAAPLDEP